MPQGYTGAMGRGIPETTALSAASMSIKAPKPRDYTSEVNNILNPTTTGLVTNTLQGLVKRGNKQEINLEKSRAQLALSLNPVFNRAAYEAQNATFANSLSQVKQHAGQITGDLNAISPGRNATETALVNSLQAPGNAALDSLNTQSAGMNNGTQSALLQSLNTQAQQGLALGGILSDQASRDATQAARSAFADRGMTQGNAAIAQELLNRDAYSQQRLQQRQQFGSQVQGLDMAQQGQNEAFQQGVAGLNQAAAGQQQTHLLNVNNAVNANAAQALGFYTGQNVSPITNVAAVSQGPTVGASNASTALSGLLGYGSDVYNTNTNMQASLYNASKNNAAAGQAAGASQTGAYVGAGAAVAAAALIAL